MTWPTLCARGRRVAKALYDASFAAAFGAGLQGKRTGQARLVSHFCS